MHRALLSIVLSAFILSLNSLALPGFPDGVYAGEGTMREGAGPEQTYQAKLTLNGMEMVAKYVYPDGHPVEYQATLKSTKDGQYDVIAFDKSIGRAYCQDGMCHFDVPAHKAEETLIFRDGKIFRVGSMEHPAALLIYSETLTPLATETNDEVVLECQGEFQHSQTVSVSVEMDESGRQTLREFQKKGEPAERLVSDEEAKNCAYQISSVFGMTRTIRKIEGQWVLDYSCGEQHPLECTTSLPACE